ncbi:glycoside hydrolase [Fistulina hepatica ATCC 64428]|uniref:Glycoside hydrolase n=1 Tax=Fistulina hepatica ATCC 64428 TaxID=1128425 RepID=A0A0D7AE48_9AGAR|nr:glycoside hydrolase [Fistulina hepatica ATCC 64428]
MSISVPIVKHTTSSTPHPCISLKFFAAAWYIDAPQFVRLHELLDDPYVLPDKKVAHQLLPLAWLDDDLLCERKHGLSGCMNDLLRDPVFNSRPEPLDFLAVKLDTPLMTSVTGSAAMGLVSTDVSARKNISRPASCIAASYYPNWVLDTFPLENIDFSKFDVIYYDDRHSSQDSGNFLQFLQALRSALGPRKIISAAVTHLPWRGSDGRPMSDVSDYAAELTYLNIMNYDVNDPSSDPTPSPNAPLGNHCGNSSQPEANASAALASWTSAGFPAHKLVLGLAIYGYVYQSTRTTLSQVVRPPRMTRPCRLLGFSGCVTDGSGDLSSMFGRQIPFLQLIDAGVLYRADDGSYKAKNGYTRGWDHCSTTPFLYSQERRTVVSYDDPTSLGAKARFARSQGMAGCFTWSLEQDDDGHLQDSIRINLGKS